MRCSFLVKIESLSLQLYNQPNSFTGIVLVFCDLKIPYTVKHLLVAASVLCSLWNK